MQHAVALLLLSSPALAQLGVASVSPPRQALAVSTATNVVVTFDAPVDAGTLGADTFRVFGRWSGPRTGELSAAGSTVTWRPDRPFFPGEYVTVTLSEGVQGTGGAPLDGGSTWSFWTRAGAGSGAFALADVVSTRLPGEGLIQSYGIYAGDLDRDGAPDFSIPNEVANDVRVMPNDGCGVFGTPDPIDVPPGSTPSANDAGDFNADGYPDMAVANISGDTVSVLLADGLGSYQDAVTYPSGDASRGVAVLDLEGDGDSDFAVTLRNASKVALHQNTGAGVFAAPAVIEGGVNGETSVVAVDADGDGISDLYVGGYDSQTLAVLLGQGDGTFVLSDTSSAGGRPWQLAQGDVDGDGDADVATCNSNTSSSSILRGDGAGALANPETYLAGAFALAVDLGDAEGDGDLDLAVSNYGAGTWTFRLNDGTGLFGSPTTLQASFAGSCMIFVDDDRDGDMDLVGIDEVSDELFFFRQQSPAFAGVAPGACDARLRVNSLAGNAGFGALPPHPVSLAERAFLDVTTEAGAAFAIGVGQPLAPGAPTVFGLLNLSPAYLLASGVADGHGEGRVALDLPPTLGVGSGAALQAFTMSPGAFSNAEGVVIAP
jgi:hypothetical protein